MNYDPLVNTADKAVRKIAFAASNQISSKLYVHLLNEYINSMHRAFPTRFTDANVHKLLYVDPHDVQFLHDNRYRSFGRVKSGTWDLAEQDCAEKTRSVSIIKHFNQGKPWKETEYYFLWTNKVENQFDNWRNFQNKKQIKQFFSNIDELHDNIKKEGYVTQRELLTQNRSNTVQANNDALHPLLNEVGINIGRNGEYFFSQGGLHRLSIAKALQISKIPVVVRVRHQSWQEIRNKYKQTNKMKMEYRSHPDLDDLG